MVGEVWKDIQGYEGYFQVSNLSNVRSLDRITIGRYGMQKRKGKLMTQHIDQDGYMKVGITKEKVRKHYFVHRLISIAFINNSGNKAQINHKDGNKQNNSLSNLEWCSITENNNHALNSGLRKMPNGNNHSNAKITEDEAIWIKYMTNGQKLQELVDIFGICKATICKIKTNKIWRHI